MAEQLAIDGDVGRGRRLLGAGQRIEVRQQLAEVGDGSCLADATEQAIRILRHLDALHELGGERTESPLQDQPKIERYLDAR